MTFCSWNILGPTRCTFVGSSLKLHATKMLMMWENIHGFALFQAQVNGCLCDSGISLGATGGKVESYFATQVMCACLRASASFEKMSFQCPCKQKMLGNHWNDIFLGWRFHSLTCPYGGEKSSLKI